MLDKLPDEVAGRALSFLELVDVERTALVNRGMRKNHMAGVVELRSTQDRAMDQWRVVRCLRPMPALVVLELGDCALLDLPVCLDIEQTKSLKTLKLDGAAVLDDDLFSVLCARGPRLRVFHLGGFVHVSMRSFEALLASVLLEVEELGATGWTTQIEETEGLFDPCTKLRRVRLAHCNGLRRVVCPAQVTSVELAGVVLEVDAGTVQPSLERLRVDSLAQRSLKGLEASLTDLVVCRTIHAPRPELSGFSALRNLTLVCSVTVELALRNLPSLVQADLRIERLSKLVVENCGALPELNLALHSALSDLVLQGALQRLQLLNLCGCPILLDNDGTISIKGLPLNARILAKDNKVLRTPNGGLRFQSS